MDIKKIKVENMESPRSYRPVANQFIITTDEGVYFQSYKTLIAFEPNYNYQIKNKTNCVMFVDRWDYSATTLKYFKQFAGLESYSKKEIKKMIKEGRYIETNLN